ncbi:hypothetical protein PMIN06_004902 [Paraphaeosphaeria minitans]|uniref:Uncharacterized protein n=1 Tax=Paraphaeosphaeria minitans TaxID=565426 RepID=A0A9P6GQ44_9PLEO|nr:hypothetical protein PMIN01_02451 [Paraphaeosphaeria minitans]
MLPLSNNSADNSPPKTPASPLPPGLVKKIAEKYERPKLQVPDAKPAKPLRDLKEEYKDPWKEKKRREEELRERVRKGDGGLDPHLREPWERARGEAGASPVDSDGRGGDVKFGAESDEGERDACVRLQLPQQASLHLLRTQPTLLNVHTTPFAYAVDPYLQNNPEYRHYLSPTTPSSSSSALFNLPSAGSSVHSGEVSARTDEAFPEIPFESIEVYLRERDKLQVRLQIQQVRTLLLRCAVLVRSAWALEQTEWTTSASVRWRSADADADDESRMGQAWYKAYSKAGRAAEKAGQMAKALGIDGLQARTWYWKGQADAGRRYWDEAGAAFRRAGQFDREKSLALKVEEYGQIGLTPVERRVVGELRRRCEEEDERVQWRRLQREWARDEVSGEELDESDDEFEEELVDLKVLRGVIRGEVGVEESVDAVKEQLWKLKEEEMLEAISVARAKNKTRWYFEKFSKEELAAIMDGVPIPKKQPEQNMMSEGFQDDFVGWEEGGRISVSSSEADAV